jgi:hypothetical protein
MLPNWESDSQNQPRPNVAVSVLAGAAASMGGAGAAEAVMQPQKTGMLKKTTEGQSLIIPSSANRHRCFPTGTIFFAPCLHLSRLGAANPDNFFTAGGHIFVRPSTLRRLIC